MPDTDPLEQFIANLPPPPSVDEVKGMVSQSAQKYGLDENLLHAVAQRESGYNAAAVSPKGAIGAMQLMPDTAKGLGADPNDPAQNVDAGARYLRQLIDRYNGDTRKALAAYNAGPARVDSGKPLPQETQDYVDAISPHGDGDLDQFIRTLPDHPSPNPSAPSSSPDLDSFISGLPSEPKLQPQPQQQPQSAPDEDDDATGTAAPSTYNPTMGRDANGALTSKWDGEKWVDLYTGKTVGPPAKQEPLNSAAPPRQLTPEILDQRRRQLDAFNQSIQQQGGALNQEKQRLDLLSLPMEPGALQRSLEQQGSDLQNRAGRLQSLNTLQTPGIPAPSEIDDFNGDLAHYRAGVDLLNSMPPGPSADARELAEYNAAAQTHNQQASDLQTQGRQFQQDVKTYNDQQAHQQRISQLADQVLTDSLKGGGGGPADAARNLNPQLGFYKANPEIDANRQEISAELQRRAEVPLQTEEKPPLPPGSPVSVYQHASGDYYSGPKGRLYAIPQAQPTEQAASILPKPVQDIADELRGMIGVGPGAVPFQGLDKVAQGVYQLGDVANQVGWHAISGTAATPNENLPRQAAAGAGNVISGGLEIGSVLVPYHAITDPIRTVGTLAAWELASKGTEKGLEAAGVPQEYSELAGQIAGLGAGALSAAGITEAAKLFEPGGRFGPGVHIGSLSDEQVMYGYMAARQAGDRDALEMFGQEGMRRQAAYAQDATADAHGHQGPGLGAPSEPISPEAPAAPPPQAPPPAPEPITPEPQPSGQNTQSSPSNEVGKQEEPATQPAESAGQAPPQENLPAIAKGATYETPQGRYRVEQLAGDRVVFTVTKDGKTTPGIRTSDDFRDLVGLPPGPVSTGTAGPVPTDLNLNRGNVGPASAGPTPFAGQTPNLPGMPGLQPVGETMPQPEPIPGVAGFLQPIATPAPPPPGTVNVHGQPVDYSQRSLTQPASPQPSFGDDLDDFIRNLPASPAAPSALPSPSAPAGSSVSSLNPIGSAHQPSLPGFSVEPDLSTEGGSPAEPAESPAPTEAPAPQPDPPSNLAWTPGAPKDVTGQFATPADYYRSARTELEASKNVISAEHDRLKATAGKKGAADLRRQISAEANAHRNAYAGKLAEAEQTLGPRAAEQMRSDVEGTPAPADKTTPAPEQYHQFFNGIRRGDSIATPQGNFQVTKADAMLMQPVMPTGRQWGAIGGASREVLSVTGHLPGQPPQPYDKRQLEELLYPKAPGATALAPVSSTASGTPTIRIARQVRGDGGEILKTETLGGWFMQPNEWPGSARADQVRKTLADAQAQEPGLGWHIETRGTDSNWHPFAEPAAAAPMQAAAPPTTPAPHEGDIVAFNGPGGETVGPQAGEGRIVKTYSDGTHEVRIPPEGANPARSAWIKPGQVYSVNGTAVGKPAEEPAAPTAATEPKHQPSALGNYIDSLPHALREPAGKYAEFILGHNTIGTVAALDEWRKLPKPDQEKLKHLAAAQKKWLATLPPLPEAAAPPAAPPAAPSAAGATGLTPAEITKRIHEKLAKQLGQTAPKPPAAGPATPPAKKKAVPKQRTAPAATPASSTLDDAAAAALKRLNEKYLKKRAPNGPQFSRRGPKPEELADDLIDLGTIGAQHILRGAEDFPTWSAKMQEDFGGLVDAIAGATGMTPQQLLQEVHGYATAAAEPYRSAPAAATIQGEQPNVQQRAGADDRESLEGTLPQGNQPNGEGQTLPAGGGARSGQSLPGDGAGDGHGSELQPGPGVGAGGVETPANVDRNLPPRSGSVGNTRHEHDYRIPDNRIISGTPEARARVNIEAIRLMRQIQKDQRAATVEEKEVLARYVGWGAAKALFAGLTPEWQAAQQELRDLLSEDEYGDAERSVTNAHYTGDWHVDAMWNAMRHLGAKPNMTWLEPAVGIGTFFGRQPADLLEGAKRLGIDKDSVVGQLAKLLYPDSGIDISPLEDAELPKNYFHGGISNVPFGEFGVSDPAFRGKPFLTYPIHNYFFARSLELLRPGGVLGFVTSRYTMDGYAGGHVALRNWINGRADFLGAVRMPANAFMQNAGTHVITDIVFLRKRLPNADPAGQPWEKTENLWLRGPSGQTYDIPINQYYAAHPEMALGTAGLERGQFSDHDYTLKGKLTPEALNAALLKLPPNQFQEWEPAGGKKVFALGEIANAAAKEFKLGGLFFDDQGNLFRKTSKGSAEPNDVPEPEKARVRGQLGIRDALKQLLTAEREDAPEKQLGLLRERLNLLYDRYVNDHGVLSKRASQAAMAGDPDAPMLLSLERRFDGKNAADKAPIFERRILQGQKQIASVGDPREALSVVLNEKARLDWDRMAELTGMSPEDLQADLRGRGLVFEDPTDRTWQTADEYLSGAVRSKLTQARAVAKLEPAFADNVRALEAAQPEDIPPSQITGNLGATWVPLEAYNAFAKEVTGAKEVSIHYAGGHWDVQVKFPGHTNWGTADVQPTELLTSTLNSQRIKVYGRDENNKPVVDAKATLAAQQKQKDLNEYFAKWLFEDTHRGQDIAQLYNQTQNDLRLRQFDGSHLTLPGMTRDAATLRGGDLADYQKAAVWRQISQRMVYLAHAPGAGKTFEMIAAGMELKRLGLVQRPMYVVPNSTLTGWQQQFAALYPEARVLVFSEKDLQKKNRQRTIAMIATGEWDAVVAPHSSFQFIRTGDALFNEHYQKLEAQLEEQIMEAEGADLDIRFVRRLQVAKENLLTSLKNRRNQERQDLTVNWEELGIDQLFVDEAHEYKKLGFTTRQAGVAGIDQKGNQKTFDLLMKVRHVQKTGRGVVFASGTPVTNTMGELFNILQYLHQPEIEARGIGKFDEWAAAYARTVPNFEPKPEGGGYQSKQRFSQFVNLPNLAQLFRSFGDVMTSNMLNIPRPAIAGGGRRAIETQLSEAQEEYLQRLRSRAKSIRANAMKALPDNMLAIYGDATAMSLDLRLVDPHAGDDRDNRVNAAANEIYKIWEASKEAHGTQLVFSDLGKPLSARGSRRKKKKAKGTIAQFAGLDAPPLANRPDFSVYDELIRKLVQKGIPAEEIAHVYQAKDKNQRTRLFQSVDEGQIRVLLGSTQKMGVGVNVQKHVVAIHHLDVPHRPDQLEQREARGIRQGNENPEVHLIYYLTKGSLDEMKFGNVRMKAKFINDFLEGKLSSHTAEDVGEMTPSLEAFQAAASGDPRVMRKLEVDSEVDRYGSLRSAWRDKQWKDRLEVQQRIPEAIAAAQSNINRYQGMAATRDKTGRVWVVDSTGGGFFSKGEVQRWEGDGSQGKASEPLYKAVQAIRESPMQVSNVDIGHAYGLKLRSDGRWINIGNGNYDSVFVADAAPGGIAAKVANFIHSLETRIEAQRANIAEAKESGRQIAAALEAEPSWPMQAQLDKLLEEQQQLFVALGGDKGDEGAALVEPGTDIADASDAGAEAPEEEAQEEPEDGEEDEDQSPATTSEPESAVKKDDLPARLKAEGSGLIADYQRPRGGRIAAPDNGWQTGEIDGEPAYTDGHVMLKGQPPTPKTSDAQLNFAGLWKRITEMDNQPVRPVAFSGPEGSAEGLIWFDNGTTVDTKLYNHITKRYPDAQFLQSKSKDNSAAVVITSGGKTVGLVMPIRNAGVPPAVAEALKRSNEAAPEGDRPAFLRSARPDSQYSQHGPIQFRAHGNAIVVTPAGLRAVAAAWGEPGNLLGVAMNRHQALQVAQVLQGKAKPLAEAIAKAASLPGSGSVVIADGENSLKDVATILRHERWHLAQDQLRGFLDNHLGSREQEFLNLPMARVAAIPLKMMGYATHELAAELGAHLAAGQYQQLGLTRPQWKQLFYNYLQLLKAEHGDKLKEALTSVHPVLQEAVRAATESADPRAVGRTGQPGPGGVQQEAGRAAARGEPQFARGPTGQVEEEWPAWKKFGFEKAVRDYARYKELKAAADQAWERTEANLSQDRLRRPTFGAALTEAPDIGAYNRGIAAEDARAEAHASWKRQYLDPLEELGRELLDSANSATPRNAAKFTDVDKAAAFLQKRYAPPNRTVQAAKDFLSSETGTSTVAQAAAEAAQNLTKAKDDVLKLLAPAAREGAAPGAMVIRHRAAEMAQRTARAEQALESARKAFSKMPEADRWAWYDRVENGISDPNPQLESIAKLVRGLLAGRRADVQGLGTGKLQKFIENYMPHAYKDPQKAGQLIGEYYGKRPMEGSKSFLKARKFETLADGMAAGLEPISDNPMDMVLLKLREMDKYIMAHRVLNDLKAQGLSKFVSVFDERPQGWQNIDDRIGTVYGPPTVNVREAFDAQLMDRLENLAAGLGIRHDRKVSIGGQRLGYTSQGGPIVTKFAGPESVLIHEIGHQLEFKFGLWDRLKNLKYPDREKELRALADLRYEGDPNVSKAFKKYVREKDEKIANAVAALVYAPERFQEVAPNTWDALRDELWHIPAVRPLFEAKRSMTLGTRTAEVPVGGMVTTGHWAMPEPVARLVNNFLSPGLGNSQLYRLYQQAGNTLNNFQLGFSAFHLGFTSIDAATSGLALGIYEAAHGHPVRGLVDALKSPVEVLGVPLGLAAKGLQRAGVPGAVNAAAPASSFLRGDRLLQEYYKPGTQGAQIADLVQAVILAGGRAGMDKLYQVQTTQKMMDAFHRGGWGILSGALRIPFALAEQSVRPILEYIVPRQKLGVFADLAQFELDRMAAGEIPAEQLPTLLARAWDSVDNRLGQLVYDNLFWNKTVKDLLMVSARSVGWNTGTIGEVLGGMADFRHLLDTKALPPGHSNGLPSGPPRVLPDGSLQPDVLPPLPKGKAWAPDLTTRSSYVIALPMMVALIGSIVFYLYNGKGPESMADRFQPRTGRLDKSGQPERVNLPSYVKDIIGVEEKGLWRTAKDKIHPLLTLIADELANEDFKHKPIVQPNDSLLKSVQERLMYALRSYESMAQRNMEKEKDRNATPSEYVAPFFGVTPAPAAGNRMMKPAPQPTPFQPVHRQPHPHKPRKAA